MLCAVLLFYDKLLNLRQSDISTLSVTHVQNINFGSIRHNPKYTFTLLFISLPSVDGDPDDSTVIYFLLLLTCKVCEGDYSRHWIGLLPIEFVHLLGCRGNSIVFNLVFSFSCFSILQVDFFDQDTRTML
jgi:hypothetical protein